MNTILSNLQNVKKDVCRVHKIVFVEPDLIKLSTTVHACETVLNLLATMLI